MPKTQRMSIATLGHLQESRVFNVQTATFKNNEHVFINLERNQYTDEEVKITLQKIFNGQELSFNAFSNNPENI